jgi:hypothetical protein
MRQPLCTVFFLTFVLWFQMAATGPGKITNIFPNYLLYEFQGLSGGRIWKAEHDLLLLRGILKYETTNIFFVTISSTKLPLHETSSGWNSSGKSSLKKSMFVSAAVALQ